MSRGHVPDTSLQAALDQMAAFTAGVEQRLNSCLRAGTIPDADLVDAIAVANQSPRLPESIRDCPSLPDSPSPTSLCSVGAQLRSSLVLLLLPDLG